MGEPRARLIVFSKDRPLQLHGYLTSLLTHWQGIGTVDVLVRSEGGYDAAYSAVRDEFFPRVNFRYERDFGADLLRILGHSDSPFTVEDAFPYVCFGTDDVVFTGPVDLAEIDHAFRTQPRLLGLSLRLGKHVEADMFGRPMPQPALGNVAPPSFEEYTWANAAELRMQWDAATSAGDWGYPWEVLGTVYPTDYVRETVAALVRDGQVQNPSTLEDAGWRRWREFAGDRHLMQCFSRSRLVVPTVNVVQSVFGNGIVGPGGMDPAFLLDCWNRGLRLDVDRYRGMTPPSWRISDLYLRRAG